MERSATDMFRPDEVVWEGYTELEDYEPEYQGIIHMHSIFAANFFLFALQIFCL